MTDKVQLIKAEIEKKIKESKEREKKLEMTGQIHPDIFERPLRATLKEVLKYIESIACDNMGWISVNEQLPEVDVCGESEYVLACNCRTREIPSIVKFSDGRYSRKGWWLRTFCHLSMNVKRSSKEFGTNLRFTHWAKIELPKEN